MSQSRFSQTTASSQKMINIEMEAGDFQNHQFQRVKLPLDPEARYFHFRQMMWQYGRRLISDDDFSLSARPKKQVCIFGLSWCGVAVYLRMEYFKNAEKVFKRFLLTPASPIFFIMPFVAVYWYIKAQSKVYHQIYERTVGHLSDRELLELDQKLNPSKQLIYA